MAVVIRMKRMGRRNRPTYRIAVADRALPATGRTLDNLGHYDPASPKEELRLRIDLEKAREWIAKGAQPSETVRSILRRGGALEGLGTTRKRDRSGRKKVTARRKARTAAKAQRATAKEARHAERVAQRRAVKKAAAAEAAAEE